MVKHVYYKKQATGCTWHLLSKMEKQTKLEIRRERDRKRKECIRQDQLMIGYIKVKHPLIYEQAREYYNTMNSMYSNKKDLRKTASFKDFEVSTFNRPTKSNEPAYNDNMVLEIPLINPETKEPEETVNQEAEERMNSETVNQEAEERMNSEAVDSIFLDIPAVATEETVNREAVDTIFPNITEATLIQELPADLIQQIINDLRADPELASLMNDIEEEVMNEEQVEDLDMDIDIDIAADLLEKELLYLQ